MAYSFTEIFSVRLRSHIIRTQLVDSGSPDQRFATAGAYAFLSQLASRTTPLGMRQECEIKTKMNIETKYGSVSIDPEILKESVGLNDKLSEAKFLQLLTWNIQDAIIQTYRECKFIGGDEGYRKHGRRIARLAQKKSLDRNLAIRLSKFPEKKKRGGQKIQFTGLDALKLHKMYDELASEGEVTKLAFALALGMGETKPRARKPDDENNGLDPLMSSYIHTLDTWLEMRGTTFEEIKSQKLLFRVLRGKLRDE